MMAAELGDRLAPDARRRDRPAVGLDRVAVPGAQLPARVRGVPAGRRPAPGAAPAAGPRRRVAGHAALRRPRLRPGGDRRRTQAFARRKRDGQIPPHCRFQVSLPTPLAPIAAFVAAEDQARIEPLYEARMLHELDDDLRRHPARPARHPVGHELRVRHARRGHAGVVRRPAVEHRRAARPARSQHPRRRPARLPLLPRPRAPPPRPALRRPAARRHRQRPVAQPRPLARLGPPARSQGGRVDVALLRDAGAARRSARRRRLYLGLLHPADGLARRQGPDRRRPALRPRLRRGHRLRLGPPPSPGRRAADRAAPRRHHGDPSRRRGAPTAFAWPAGWERIPDDELDHASRSTPSARPTTTSTSHSWYRNLDPTVEELAHLLDRRRHPRRLLGRHRHPARPPEAAHVRHPGRRRDRRQLAEVPARRPGEVPRRPRGRACGCCAS